MCCKKEQEWHSVNGYLRSWEHGTGNTDSKNMIFDVSIVSLLLVFIPPANQLVQSPFQAIHFWHVQVRVDNRKHKHISYRCPIYTARPWEEGAPPYVGFCWEGQSLLFSKYFEARSKLDQWYSLWNHHPQIDQINRSRHWLIDCSLFFFFFFLNQQFITRCTVADRDNYFRSYVQRNHTNME